MPLRLATTRSQRLNSACLLAAVVKVALRDLQRPEYQEDAKEFMESEELELFCDWLEWDAEAIRCAASEGIAPRCQRWG